MKCDQCSAPMVNVGRMTGLGRLDLWIDGYVCTTKGCSGYALHNSDGSSSRWPAATLDSGVSVHARIFGAITFRDNS